MAGQHEQPLALVLAGHPVRPGRVLLNAGDGTLLTVTVPTGSPSP